MYRTSTRKITLFKSAGFFTSLLWSFGLFLCSDILLADTLNSSGSSTVSEPEQPVVQLLDQFLVQVNDTVILDSDVALEMAVVTFLAEREGRLGSIRTRNEVLQELVNRELLLEEARKFINQSITRAEIVQRIDQMDQRMGGRNARLEFMKKNAVSESMWRMRIQSQIQLEKFLDQRVRAFVRVSRKQVDKYLEDHADELGINFDELPDQKVPLEHPLREVVQSLLELQAFDQRKEELLDDIKTTARIRATNQSRPSSSREE